MFPGVKENLGRTESRPFAHDVSKALLQKLHQASSPETARLLRAFFKTGPGQYGEGDIFIGVKIPVIRRLLPQGDALSPTQIESMLHSGIHEERLLALLIWVRHYQRGDLNQKKYINSLYLKNTRWINNWDLVDLSAYHILGHWLLDQPRGILHQLAHSPLLWERRIAIVSTFALIRENQFEDTLNLCAGLLQDREDLMHKACGWMLRELGKRDEKVLRQFLDQHRSEMPRTMLRYAIEKFPEPLRQRYLRS
ncbi:MAG: DNA alkylation repair protein [Blastochloris sp.]|nr:DNA alkylation repair protein [Blastochloris sp.]